MDTLTIHLFGQLRVYQSQRRLIKFPTTKTQKLFCYLVLRRHHCHARSVLASLFWGDSPEEQARNCLRTDLWRLRRLLEPEREPAGKYLIIENDDVCFNTDSEYWLDVQEFERMASQGGQKAGSALHQDAADHLQSALDLYQGDLLEGCYEDWCLYERERLQGMYLSVLAKLMSYHRAQEAYEDAIQYGLRILHSDPLLEEVHREVMRLHCLSGNRAAAVRQYHQCRAILARELGIEPMEETTALFAQICQGEGVQDHDRRLRDDRLDPGSGEIKRRPPGPLEPHSPLTSHVDRALNELRLAQVGVHELGTRFQKAMQSLEDIRQKLPKS